MSAGPNATPAPPPVRPQHYQLLCGLALGVVFLLLMQEGLLLFAVAVAVLGAAAVVLRLRLSPPLVLLPLVGGLLYQQYLFPAWSSRGMLRVEDVALCAAALAYVAGHYRLLSLWSHILPPDPRQRYRAGAAAVVPVRQIGKVVAHYRPAGLLTTAEVAWFVLQLPLCALAAQAAWAVLGRPREVLGLPPRWVQFVQLSWGVVLAMLLAGQFFRFTRLLQADGVTARLFLNDVLWHETRGEQRRVGRWLAWARLRRTKRR